MLEQLQSWWQNLSPQYRTYIFHGGMALGALVGGHILGVMVGRFLRARRFNSLFRVMGSVTDQPQEDRGFTPTMLAGVLVRLTIWAFACAWFLRQYGRPELADSTTKVIGQAWAVAAGLAAALALAGLLARRVIECLEFSSPVTQSRNVVQTRKVAGAVGAGIYALVVFLTLLTAADYFDWPHTRTAVADMWQLALRLLSAGAAVFVGYLGARWARECATAEDGESAPKPEQKTAMGIVVATTALAVALLVFGAGLSVGVAILAVAAGLLYLARGRLADVTAGLKLRKHSVGTAWFDGIPWQVGHIGLIQSDVTRGGTCYKVANQVVLEAAGHTESTSMRDDRPALTH